MLVDYKREENENNLMIPGPFQLFKKFDNGFSLLEVIVAMGAFSLLVIGLMKFLEVSRKSFKTIEVNSELSILHDQVLLFLKNPNNCKATFAGVTFKEAVGLKLQKGINSNGDRDPEFKGLFSENSPIKLESIKIYDPSNPKGDPIPRTSQILPPSSKPESDGWWTVVRFRYSKSKGESSKSQKVFGGDTVDRLYLMKFDNFDRSRYTTNQNLCDDGRYTVSGEGRKYTLQGSSGKVETYWIGECKNGSPALPIRSCVL